MKFSRSDSYVKMRRVFDVSGTNSFPIFSHILTRLSALENFIEHKGMCCLKWTDLEQVLKTSIHRFCHSV